MEQEGVIQYRLDWTQAAPPPLDPELEAWREVLFRLNLLGRDPTRYGGYGFGNLSRRRPPPAGEGPSFIISGTQTGHLPHLQAEHYALVTACAPEDNRVVACGVTQPSSEALTHAACYQASSAIGCVLHAHCPELWGAGEALGLPATAADIAHGTPAMAYAIRHILLSANQLPCVLTMRGHTDGIIAAGPDLASTGALLVQTLAQALSRASQ